MTRLLRVIQRFCRFIGRRGAFLLFLGQLDLTLANAIGAPLPLNISPGLVYHPFTVIAPLRVWTLAWGAVGLVAIAAALWQPMRSAAFGLAASMKTAWASGYLIGWWEHDLFYSRGYQTASLFGSLAAVTLLIAWWRENGK